VGVEPEGDGGGGGGVEEPVLPGVLQTGGGTLGELQVGVGTDLLEPLLSLVEADEGGGCGFVFVFVVFVVVVVV